MKVMDFILIPSFMLLVVQNNILRRVVFLIGLSQEDTPNKIEAYGEPSKEAKGRKHHDGDLIGGSRMALNLVETIQLVSLVFVVVCDHETEGNCVHDGEEDRDQSIEGVGEVGVWFGII